MATKVPIGTVSDHERGRRVRGGFIRAKYKCPVCSYVNKNSLEHGMWVICAACCIDVVAYGNALFISVESMQKLKIKKLRDIAERRVYEDIANRQSWNKDKDMIRRYLARMANRDAPIDVREAAEVAASLDAWDSGEFYTPTPPIDITAVASELDKRAVKGAVEEINDLKLRIQRAQVDIARMKAENADAEKELSVLKGESEEKPDEALMRFMFVMED